MDNLMKRIEFWRLNGRELSDEAGERFAESLSNPEIASKWSNARHAIKNLCLVIDLVPVDSLVSKNREKLIALLLEAEQVLEILNIERESG